LEDIKRQLDEAKKQLEAAKSDLAAKTKALAAAEEEVDAMRSAEQGQRIALLDELNSMQTENGQLRAQLRAAKAGR
jgi:outer membrane protein TolC